MEHQRYYTAHEAAQALGITLATLYAYVSRGLIRSETLPGEHRQRRYRAEDVERLRKRQDLRRDPATAAREALHWGEPVLESSISLIDSGRLYYRGYDVARLARESSVEETAALIWTGAIAPTLLFDTNRIPMPQAWSRIARGTTDLSVIERFQTLLPAAAADDPAAFAVRPGQAPAAGVRIVRMLTGVAASVDRIEGGIARTLAEAWVPDAKGAQELLSAALILSADHELNVSSFTVRCVASAGATPYAAVNAGLSALQGYRHGGHTERVEELLRGIGRPAEVSRALASRLRRGEAIPGFGHPLYPSGDPRGSLLLDLATATAPRSSRIKMIAAVVDAVRDLTGDGPTIDMGLAATAAALGLSDGSPMTLFALGRTIGWIGHAVEQYALDRMIRPRARYTGDPPRPEGGVIGNSP